MKPAEKQILFYWFQKVTGNDPKFYIVMLLTPSLFNYSKLKRTKLIAVVGLKNLMDTAEFIIQ